MEEIKKGTIMVFKRDKISTTARGGFLARVTHDYKSSDEWLKLEWVTDTNQCDGNYYRDDFDFSNGVLTGTLEIF